MVTPYKMARQVVWPAKWLWALGQCVTGEMKWEGGSPRRTGMEGEGGYIVGQRVACLYRLSWATFPYCCKLFQAEAARGERFTYIRPEWN